MQQSLSYYLTLFVIQLKGIKKAFSQDPINVQKIRKEDIHQPKGKFFRNHIWRTFQIADSQITEIGTEQSTNQLLLFIHGGAYISGPAQHHWDSVKTIIKQTNCKVWMCNYPKAPENTIQAISDNIDSIYAAALQEYPDHQIALIGDSVGGALVTSLVQRLIAKNNKLPSKIVLVSPVMDASMSNPAIETVEQLDPMLAKNGVLSAKKMCAGSKDLKNSMISPLYASFEHFPPTLLFLAQSDIMYPDGKLAAKKMEEADVPLELVEGENMPHIWPFLPVMKEARLALGQIIQYLRN